MKYKLKITDSLDSAICSLDRTLLKSQKLYEGLKDVFETDKDFNKDMNLISLEYVLSVIDRLTMAYNIDAEQYDLPKIEYKKNNIRSNVFPLTFDKIDSHIVINNTIYEKEYDENGEINLDEFDILYNLLIDENHCESLYKEFVHILINGFIYALYGKYAICEKC